MKILACDCCHGFIPLSYDKQSCKCGLIAGKYDDVDGRQGIIWTKDKIKTRVIGVPNSLRYGLRDRTEAWII